MKIDVFLRPKKSSIFFAGEPYFEAYSNEIRIQGGIQIGKLSNQEEIKLMATRIRRT